MLFQESYLIMKKRLFVRVPFTIISNLINMKNHQIEKLSVVYDKYAHRIQGFHLYKMNMSTISRKFK